ncbi:hypothetical protein BVC93_01565 [Mycobacterium sp. MS1601]|uniref:sensor histidine kinase n=1 Tax=Mycobacterium sp. MS1601 TaxID=1936029 RepID=UPI00097942E4|nr:ATP-binding protein [Mycobacterium sp. MS1601]AQA01332.1 hypothetical protein BVC93_01565 [Mycobacterium sp. MS1601]
MAKRRRLRPPRDWGVPQRSAAISAGVVAVAWLLASIGFLVLFNAQLTAGLDVAASARQADVATALQSAGPAEIDDGLLTTDPRVTAVQILDSGGQVVRTSPDAPLIPITAAPGIRVSSGAAGPYTVLVATDSAAVGESVRLVALVLAVSTLLVVPVAAGASFLLVRRSLRSVEAIRVRVSEISGSRLDERVPVPVSRDEISALAQTMNAMLARLEASDRAQRQFVGDASHELRSPLTTIISALEVVQAHPQLLDRELALEVVLPEAQRMRVLIEDLLVLARADERGLGLRREWVRLDEVVAAEAGRLAVVSSVAVSTQLVAVSVCGDRDALVRAVRNVCDNAVRYAVSVVELSVGVDVCPDGVTAVVRVGDDGPGVPVADRVRVFDRFVRVGADRSRRGGGAGLGLAIVAEVVSGHGGSVAITDRTAGGTHVTITLPGARPEAA